MYAPVGSSRELNALSCRFDTAFDRRSSYACRLLSAALQGAGIMNLRFVVGHDEYMYRWLKFNKVPLAEIPEVLAIVRLHSCYPWHTGGSYR